MIHGACVSIGCYAMTNAYMDEIFSYVNAALRNGQPEVAVSIYPFRMTESNMQRHRNSYYASFWKELQPGYAYFVEHRQPPTVAVNNGRYVLNGAPVSTLPPPRHSRRSPRQNSCHSPGAIRCRFHCRLAAEWQSP